MTMRIVYADDESHCVSINFNSANCTTWRTLVDMYPDVFVSSYSNIYNRYTINIDSNLLKTTPNNYHYDLRKKEDGSYVFMEDEIIFDSSNSTTYILQLESSTSVGGGSSD